MWAKLKLQYIWTMQKIKNPLTFIFITVLIDCIGIRIAYPVAATIVSEVGHMSVNEAVKYSGWMMAMYAVMQLIFSPILGGLSDKYGRRPVLLLSLLGLGINYLFLANATSLTMLFAGRIIAGICGASFTTGFAYVADISAPEKRAQNFGLIGTAFGLGFIIGPLLGGVFSEFGTRVPFIAAAVLSLLNLLYGFFVLPESLLASNRRNFNLSRANPLGAFYQLRANGNIKLSLFALFFIFLAVQVMPAVWPFYTKYLFHWTDLEIGYSLAFVGLMVALVKSGLIKLAQKVVGPYGSVYYGLFFYFLGLSLFTFVNQAWMIYAIMPFYCLGGVASPSLQGIISSKVTASEQGELQGAITSIMSLSNILAPILMSNLFYLFTKESDIPKFPGAPFALSALFIAFSFYLCKKNFKKEEYS